MKIIDLHDPERVNRNPDDIKIILETGNFIQDEFTISKIELRLYTEKKIFENLAKLEGESSSHTAGDFCSKDIG